MKKLSYINGPDSPIYNDNDEDGILMRHRAPAAQPPQPQQARPHCNLTSQQTAFISVCALATLFCIAVAAVSLTKMQSEADNTERTRHALIGGLEMTGAMLCMISAAIIWIRPSSCLRNDLPEENDYHGQDHDESPAHTESSPLLPKSGYGSSRFSRA